MDNFFKKNRLLVASLIFLILIFILFRFVVSGQIHDLEANMERIQKKTIDNELNKARIDKIPEMEVADRNYQEKKGSLDVILSQNSEVDFIRKLEYLAEETGNKIELKINETTDLDDEKKKAAPKADEKNKKKTLLDDISYNKYLKMEITLTGDWQSFARFVHKMENLNYYINVMSFSVKKVDVDEAKDSSASDNRGFFAAPIKRSGEGESKPILEEVKETLKSSINVIVYLEK